MSAERTSVKGQRLPRYGKTYLAVSAKCPRRFKTIFGRRAKSLDIDTLENGRLNISYPAIRQALADHPANEVKNV